MDITNPRILFLKAGLFIVAGLLAAGMIVMESPTLRTVVLLTVAIWAFSRAYYFAFYVVSHYVDPSYRFAGLWDFARYISRRRRRSGSDLLEERSPIPHQSED